MGDTCDTVSEAKAAMQTVTIAGVGANGVGFGVHVAVEDKSGDSAIFEFVNGRLWVYPPEGSPEGSGLGHDYQVMTNDPELPLQLAHRDTYMTFGKTYPGGLKFMCNDTKGRDCSTFATEDSCPSTCMWKDKTGCQLEFPNDCLPGDITSRARFVRLSYFLHFLDDAGIDGDTMSGDMRGVLLSAAVPRNAPDQDEWDDGVYPTWWYSVIDHPQQVYYFGWYGNLNTIYIDLGGLPRSVWSHERKMKYLNPQLKGLVGDVTSLFSDTQPPAAVAEAKPQLQILFK